MAPRKRRGKQGRANPLARGGLGALCGFLGFTAHLFPQKILKAAQTRPELSVVNDQVGSPTYTRDLACAIRDLVRQDARGITHITNEGVCSWFDFAREILLQSGGQSVPVLPI